MNNSSILDRRSLVDTWHGAIIIESSIVCFSFLVFCRFKMILPWEPPYWKLPVVALVLSHEDFIALAILSFASLLLCLFVSPRLRRYIAFTHGIIILLIANVGFINSIVQPQYNTAVSMGLLKYSGALDFGSIYTLVSYLS